MSEWTTQRLEEIIQVNPTVKLTKGEVYPFIDIDKVSPSLRSVTNDYSKWLEDGIDFVASTDETFDEIKFTMSNGKSFIICADDAEVDGYTLFWSENTDEAITER